MKNKLLLIVFAICACAIANAQTNNGWSKKAQTTKSAATTTLPADVKSTKSSKAAQKSVLSRKKSTSGVSSKRGRKSGKAAKLDYENYSPQLERAASNGDVEAQYALAMLYFSGEGGVTENKRESTYWLEKAARNGHLTAQTAMGIMWENGIGVDSVDVVQAAAWYKKAADRDDYVAQYFLGNIYRYFAYYIEDDDDRLSAFKDTYDLFFRSANQGYAPSMYRLGLMFINGEYVTADERKAREWFEKGAKLNDDECVYALGVFYRDERGGLEQDYEMAFKCFKWASEQENMDAMDALGLCYQKGLGCVRDERKAMDCYATAGNEGILSARYNWAFCTYFGIGVDRPNEQTAIEIMDEVARNGHMPAVDFMTEYQKEYFKGEGMVQVDNYKPKNAKRCNVVGRNSSLRVIGISYDDTYIRLDFEDDCSEFMWASISRDTWIRDNLGGMSQMVYSQGLRIAPNLSFLGSDVNKFRFSLYFYRQTIKGAKIDFVENGSDWVINDIMLPTKKDKDNLDDETQQAMIGTGGGAALGAAIGSLFRSKSTGESETSDDDITPGVQVNRLISTDIQDWLLKSIEIKDGSTIAHWRVTDKSGGTYAYMTYGVYLMDEKTKKKYYATGCNGLEYGQNKAKILSRVGEYVDFSVSFPALPKSTKSVTYYSSDSFMISGIRLK